MIAGLSGAVLLAASFMDWYSVRLSGRLVGLERLAGALEPVDAWQAFAVEDLAILLAIVLAVAQLLFRPLDDLRRLPLPAPYVVALAGGLAALLVLVRLLDPPIAEVALPGIEVGPVREAGAYLGLAACAGIALGGLLGARERGAGE